jgi:parvulin-like peptidyl-prolyl isomerase
MKKYYDAHVSDYNKPEEVRVSAIIVKDKSKADKAATEAKAAANADNKAFRDLVDKYSEDADSKSRGGDLRFFAADNKAVPPEVVKAAMTLKNQGDVAGPIQTSGGYYVIKQTGLRKEIKKTFEEVKRQIQNRLFRDKRTEAMDSFVAELKKNAKIDVKPDALAKVKVDTTQPSPVTPEDPGAVPPTGAAVPGQPPPPGPRVTLPAPAPEPLPAPVPPATK